MAVIGDAAEHGETGLKLWVFVVQVAASLLWKAVAEQPGRMACLAVAGTLMQAMFWSLGVLCVLISATVALVCLALVRGEVTAPTNPMIYVFLLSIAVPAPWLTGRWLSRRAPGRELAPCLTMALLHAIVFAVGCAIYGDRLGLIDLPSGNVPAFLLLVANAASLFAGAAWVRERPGAALTWFERYPFDMESPRQWWRVRRIPADQQKINDWLGLFTFVAVQFAKFVLITPRTARYLFMTPRTARGVLDAYLTVVFLWYVLFGRPFAGGRGRLRVWFGRLLTGGIAAWLAYSSYLELTGR